MSKFFAKVYYTDRVWDPTEKQIVERERVEEEFNSDNLIDLLSSFIDDGIDFRVEFP